MKNVFLLVGSRATMAVFGEVPSSLSVRTWRTVHGGAVSRTDGSVLAVDFPPEGYAFLSF